MSLDPMAAAIDWLEAYRAADLEAILRMYSENATVECGCSGMKTVTGSEAIRAYWVQRFRDYPAADLEDLQPSREGTRISYKSSHGVVVASLQFDPAGRITHVFCGPQVLI